MNETQCLDYSEYELPADSQPIELWKLPNHSVCSLTEDSEPFVFVKPDGMYSICVYKGDVEHLMITTMFYPWVKKKG